MNEASAWGRGGGALGRAERPRAATRSPRTLSSPWGRPARRDGLKGRLAPHCPARERQASRAAPFAEPAGLCRRLGGHAQTSQGLPRMTCRCGNARGGRQVPGPPSAARPLREPGKIPRLPAWKASGIGLAAHSCRRPCGQGVVARRGCRTPEAGLASKTPVAGVQRPARRAVRRRWRRPRRPARGSRTRAECCTQAGRGPRARRVGARLAVRSSAYPVALGYSLRPKPFTPSARRGRARQRSALFGPSTLPQPLNYIANALRRVSQ